MVKAVIKKLFSNRYVNFALILIGSIILIALLALFLERINQPTWASNTIVIGFHGLMYYYLIFALITPLEQIKPPKNLFQWLENPIIYEADPFFKSLEEIKIDKQNLHNNLNNFRLQLLIYTSHDITKLRMLKALVRTKITEGSLDTINRTIIALIAGPLFLYVIRNDSFMESIKIPLKDANQLLMNVMTVVLILLLFLSIIINIVFLFSGNKKRLKFIEEMADACIEDIKTK
ncbi:hypothetical protein V7E39_09445 [Bacillus sp. B38]|uniref:hypothetical protein n=1 Tax=Bacillus sp. B38 TaxID=218305 RepID=UPI003C79E7A9